MPKSAFERSFYVDQSSTSSNRTETPIETEKVKEFYKSIPDYDDINHFSSEDFYKTVRTLKERKKSVLRSSTGRLERSEKDKTNDRVTNSGNLNKKDSKLKRTLSSCSITWNIPDDATAVDHKFNHFFDGKNFARRSRKRSEEFKVRSMPTSPLRSDTVFAPLPRVRSVTTPKPFKFMERFNDYNTAANLRGLQKSFSADMLHQKVKRKPFKSRPVPITSRIPLYDKILEDQAMRRAISKINSEAELRAKMKPFKFTKRDDETKEVDTVCPKVKKTKRFKARSVPRNLFSNYLFEKKKQDEFFKSINRRVRAEEMLRKSSLPCSVRERSFQSTPAAHSELPIDPSPVSDDSKRKAKRGAFITTTPQPFRLSTAARAAKKMQDLTKKIYSESKTSHQNSDTKSHTHSTPDLRSTRCNLAALLRAEAVRKKFEMEAAEKLEEERRKSEIKVRNRMLRSNPAWHLVRNDYEEDIAMRLQTRRDEERMRREEFLHQMELMYGRVQGQPMMFERSYQPKKFRSPDISPRKGKIIESRKSSKASEQSQKVMDYLNRIANEENLFYDDADAVAE